MAERRPRDRKRLAESNRARTRLLDAVAALDSEVQPPTASAEGAQLPQERLEPHPCSSTTPESSEGAVEADSYKRARGVVKGTEPAEDVIRRGRGDAR